MQDNELTPWFPPHVKPARKGVYQTEDAALNGMCFYNFWDGFRWYYGAREQSLHDPGYRRWNAHEWPEGAKSLKRWRGLAKKPEGA